LSAKGETPDKIISYLLGISERKNKNPEKLFVSKSEKEVQDPHMTVETMAMMSTVVIIIFSEDTSRHRYKAQPVIAR
jgi:hypothetical protein